eukprot:97231_1
MEQFKTFYDKQQAMDKLIDARALVMKELKIFCDKQQSMDKLIDLSGKYNRNEPNSDDFKEVQWIFEQTTTLQYNNVQKNQRIKDASRYWLALKKDPYWKRELHLLKQKHDLPSYTYENKGEYKGFVGYKLCLFKVHTDGIFECYENKKRIFSINLLKESWNDLKEVAGKGKKCESCWEFQYGGKTYKFASPNHNERALVMEQFKTFYDKQQAMDKLIDASGKYNRN